MIDLYDVNKTFFSNNKVEKYHIFNNISISIGTGEFVAIIGPSGSGKSTLLNIMGLLDSEYTGTYILDGMEVQSLTDKEISHFRNSKIGFIFQNFKLLPEYTVKENIQLPLLYSDKTLKSDEQIQELLKLVNLEDKLNESPQNLSGGQQQRIAIVRALVNDPKIIIADEPTGALDSHTTNDVLNILKEINKFGKTIVMVTHSKEAAAFADRTIKIVDGVLENV